MGVAQSAPTNTSRQQTRMEQAEFRRLLMLPVIQDTSSQLAFTPTSHTLIILLKHVASITSIFFTLHVLKNVAFSCSNCDWCYKLSVNTV